MEIFITHRELEVLLLLKNFWREPSDRISVAVCRILGQAPTTSPCSFLSIGLLVFLGDWDIQKFLEFLYNEFNMTWRLVRNNYELVK